LVIEALMVHSAKMPGRFVIASCAILAACSGPDVFKVAAAAGGSMQCGGNTANAANCPDGFVCVNVEVPALVGDLGGVCLKRCGGNAAHPPTCPDGFRCEPLPDSNQPFGDVGGACEPPDAD
jgi:hypothetical protein